MTVLFISDLHLSPERPETTDAFFRFMEGPARQAQALYILGDLFEYWAGDDLSDPFNQRIIKALADLAGRGVHTSLLVGNRDFLIGRRFARAAGLSLLPDPSLVPIDGHPTLLMHGDSLCTDDTAYMAFRRKVRHPLVLALLRHMPLALSRRLFIAGRRQSEAAKKNKARDIMDVNHGAVADALRAHGHPRLIHGHTHRPARHDHTVDGGTCERWVLSDWHDKATWLECRGGECRFREE